MCRSRRAVHLGVAHRAFADDELVVVVAGVERHALRLLPSSPGALVSRGRTPGVLGTRAFHGVVGGAVAALLSSLRLVITTELCECVLTIFSTTIGILRAVVATAGDRTAPAVVVLRGWAFDLGRRRVAVAHIARCEDTLRWLLEFVPRMRDWNVLADGLEMDAVHPGVILGETVITVVGWVADRTRASRRSASHLRVRHYEMLVRAEN